jgi:hypothetical protein
MQSSPGATKRLPGERLLGSGYGLVLALILVTLAFQLAAGDKEWVRVVTVVLQSATLLAALHVSVVPRWVLHAAAIATGLACLSVAGVAIGGELGEASTRGVGLLLVLVAPVAILKGAAQHFRAAGGVTLTTMFAVLCIYLLLGMAFSYVYGITGNLEDAPFFNGKPVGAENQSNYLYFSFTTLTTTGFGDFTAGTDVGRSFTITEALIGQIYLVTVVALIVGNMGRAGFRR